MGKITSILLLSPSRQHYGALSMRFCIWLLSGVSVASLLVYVRAF
jgi:hypothetical protein